MSSVNHRSNATSGADRTEPGERNNRGSFINELEIQQILSDAKKASSKSAMQVIRKALDLKGLAPDEAAILLQSEDADVMRSLFEAAGTIKDRIYGNRLVFFAPLYLSSHCNNNCLYCGFRRDNKMVERRLLDQDEIVEQVRILLRMGHKRLLLECGESPGRSPIDYVVESIGTVYSVREGGANIRRVNVNIAATEVEH
ncbi:MAG: radical SAM protein, partial [Chloroflexota bacterium]